MTHRSTLITRVHTSDGIVGEAYAGDEDATLGEIDHIVHYELAPGIVGLDAMATERCWQAGIPSPSTSCATGVKASWRSPASTPPSGTPLASRSGSRCGGCGAVIAQHSADRYRRLLRRPLGTIERRDCSPTGTWVWRASSSRSAGPRPKSTPNASSAPCRSSAKASSSPSTPIRATRSRGARTRATNRDLNIIWFEEPVRLERRRPRYARRAHARNTFRCAPGKASSRRWAVAI